MSDLENLKKFIKSNEKGGNLKNDILENSQMSSPAFKICNKIFVFSILVFIVLAILWFLTSGSFLGDGIKVTNIFELIGGKFDKKTVISNLMLRTLFFAVYMSLVKKLVSKITCPVCGNFFTGRIRLWTKNKGYDIDTRNYTEKDTDGDKYYCSDEKITHYFDLMYQCKGCGNMYIEHVNKSYTNTTKI